MCGIAGIITQAPTTPEEIASVKTANDALTHRGPDGAGEFQDINVMLAMRRLSIIDLAGGWQPLYNEDRSLALVANGEIYNFVELRKRLEQLGHRFNTNSDCETILHLYEEYDLDFVQHLRGMFAFALWDAKRKRLIVARDRMGEKPVYLYQTKDNVFFASEVKALLASGRVPFKLDATAVDLYFHYQYVPEPLTPLKGVRKLDAASLLIVDVDPWQVQERRYWRMEDAPPVEGNPANLIREQLETVSEIVIRSDVPVGISLSGGLDSSAIAALAARKYPGTMHAFSVGYPGSLENDERADARALAEQLGMPFHDVELATSEMVSFFPELVYLRDDPIADMAGFGYYSVMKLAREHNVPVVLQGQGGDELFWGYGWVQAAAHASARKIQRSNHPIGAMPRYLKLNLPKTLSRVNLAEWVYGVAGLRNSWESLRRDLSSSPDQMVFYDLLADFKTSMNTTAAIYSQSFRDQINGKGAASFFTLDRPWPNIDVTLTRLICDTYLRENGITQGDRLGMASSIEMRLPLLDHRLVETVIGLRKAQSDVDKPPKAWFKEALRNLLPEHVINRRKRGFSPPVMEWHRGLFSAHGQSLRDGYLLKHGVLTETSAHHLSTGPFPTDNVTPISFKALVLEQWCRRLAPMCKQ
ncbi:MAG TPA: asparagine synthase (glutamine-hydrolyzing) [Pyrinomonadaceae bacterium]|nr:asparagine synthase (glutamine-hydrolyzing) [Pyrinomonadaceae bacterium]